MQGGREKCTIQFLKCMPDIDPYIMADSMSDLWKNAADTENVSADTENKGKKMKITFN